MSASIFGSGFGGGGGGSSITLPLAINQGGTGNVTANAGLNALAALTLGQNALFALADNVTNTAPIARVLKHTSSGTTAASFGIGDAVDLQSAAGNLRRVMTDSTALTVATDTAETATRVISTMTAGTLTPLATLGTTADIQGINISPVTNATAAQPHLTLGPIASKIGLYHSGGFLCFGVAGTQIAIASSGGFTFQSVTNLTPPATASGVVTKFGLTPAADTGTTASTEAFDVNFDLSRTRTWATGALTTQRAVRIKPPTYAFVGVSTITNAATVAIEGAPVAGTNAMIANAYSLWVQAGATRFDGNFGVNVTPVAQQNTTGTSTGFTAGSGTSVQDVSTFTGGTGATAYRISDIVKALKAYGLLAS